MAGWRRDLYSDATGTALGPAVAQHPDARQRGRVSGDGAVRRHERVGRAGHDEAVRAGRRAVGRRRAFRGRDEPPRAAAVFASARPSSSRRFTSTPARAAADARFTCWIARRSAPVETGVALIGGVSRRRPGSFPLARSSVRVRARQAAVRHPGRVVRAARADRARDAGPRDRADRGRNRCAGSTPCASGF